jgi:hypothetical protein
MPANFLPNTADSIVALLQGAALSPAFTVERSYRQWQRAHEVAEGEGLRVDVVPVSGVEAELLGRGDLDYRPRTDIVVRKKFPQTDTTAGTGRIPNAKVDELVGLVTSIHYLLTARRMADRDQAVWIEEEILAAYMPSHLLKHQFTGVVRVTHSVTVELPLPL